jgi:hypothetical protein
MTTWRTSSYSDAHGNECVELAQLPGVIGVRDSKNPNGPHLSMTADAFASLLDKVKTNKLDR